MLNKQELKPGLVIFQRSDVQHKDWHCRIKVPQQDRYKLFSLETTDVNAARDMAYKHETRMHIKIEEGVPLFNKAFATVAKEYSDLQKQRADAGEITLKRWEVEDGYISKQLNTYAGNIQITLIGEDKWKGYPLWRRSSGAGRGIDKRVSDWTIRSEMATLRSIMLFAAAKKYTPDNHKLFNARLKLDKPRGEAFTPEEYKKLYTDAREWVKKGTTKSARWYREMFQNFMLCMTNMGLRPPEARNLQWRDIGKPIKGAGGRLFLPVRVRGKGKYRTLVAPLTVATYLDRIRKISKATKPDDFVFTTFKGKQAHSLYASLLDDLLGKKETNLLYSASGKRRSTYSFRHTYATFRLMHGTDVYMLAQQMGTSVKMIEDYYGHITPLKNADAILQGIAGWEAAADVSGDTDDGVNAGGAGKKAAKPRTKK
jgi:integrase